MNDLQKHLQERWKQRRSKASNWTKLLAMVLILFALMYFVQRLGNSRNIDWKGAKTKTSTEQTQP